MKLKEYFETNKGLGVLSTADSEGKVDAAIYSRPHLVEDGTMALVMRDRLSHTNPCSPRKVNLRRPTVEPPATW